MEDCCTELRFDIIADDRQAGILEAFPPLGIGGDKDRYAVDHGYTRLEATRCVVLDGLLGAHGHVVDQNVRSGLSEAFCNVDRFAVGDAKRIVGRVLAHVRCDPVKHWPSLDFDALLGNRLPDGRRTVWLRVNCLAQITTDFSMVYVERSDELHVGRLVPPKLRMCQSALCIVLSIVFDALDE